MTIGYLNEAREEVTTVAYNAKTIRNRNYPVAKNGQFCEYLGYVFSCDGKVYSPNGNILIPRMYSDSFCATLILYDSYYKKHLVRVDLKRACDQMFGSKIDAYTVVKDKKAQYKKETRGSAQGKKKKFTQEQIESMKKDYFDYGYTYKRLMEKYDTCVVTVSKIIKGNY